MESSAILSENHNNHHSELRIASSFREKKKNMKVKCLLQSKNIASGNIMKTRLSSGQKICHNCTRISVFRFHFY